MLPPHLHLLEHKQQKHEMQMVKDQTAERFDKFACRTGFTILNVGREN